MTSFKVKSIVAVAALAAAASASAGEILIVSGLSGSSEISTTTEVLDNLKSLHTAVGNNVTVSDLLPADLSGFKQVWDIRFDQALNAAAQSEYTSFLQAGGGLFLMGENAGFMSRNDSILSLISSLGGRHDRLHHLRQLSSGQCAVQWAECGERRRLSGAGLLR